MPCKVMSFEQTLVTLHVYIPIQKHTYVMHTSTISGIDKTSYCGKIDISRCTNKSPIHKYTINLKHEVRVVASYRLFIERAKLPNLSN